MIRSPQTPEEFCWLFACACVEARHHTGNLNDNELGKALSHLNHHTYPSKVEVRLWFPRPFEILEQNGKECTMPQMQHYWRMRHCDDKEETPVYQAIVETVGMPDAGKEFVQTKCLRRLQSGSKLLIGRNVHGFELVPDDIVLIHNNIISEILP